MTRVLAKVHPQRQPVSRKVVGYRYAAYAFNMDGLAPFQSWNDPDAEREPSFTAKYRLKQEEVRADTPKNRAAFEARFPHDEVVWWE